MEVGMLSNNDYELKNESFLNIYLEDYNKIKNEAEEIKKEAELFKQIGDNVTYLAYMRKYETYMMTAETMITLAVKRPIAEA
jgi:hypothetical protein|tara:strand:- start:712 stop:957 length:246 start_codon:yes stop_codon:yes gene_type:complete